MNSASSDEGRPNGLNMASSKSRANVLSACFRCFDPNAPRKYLTAVRAASTVVNMDGSSDMIFLANVRDGVLGNLAIRSWTYAQDGDSWRELMDGVVCRTPNGG